MDDIKNHPWFRNINWEQLYDKDVVPPFEPDVGWSLRDVVRPGFVYLWQFQSKRANFDATHELEELLLEENPLKARKRKEGQDIALLSPEMRMMEQQWVQGLLLTPSLILGSFKVFDYTKAQRRSYYIPNPSQDSTLSAAAAISSSNAIRQSPQIDITRPETPSDQTGVISKTGMDVEAQILDGGGMANMGGRGGWRSSDLLERGHTVSDIRPTSTKLLTTSQHSSSWVNQVIIYGRRQSWADGRCWSEPSPTLEEHVVDRYGENAFWDMSFGAPLCLQQWSMSKGIFPCRQLSLRPSHPIVPLLVHGAGFRF